MKHQIRPAFPCSMGLVMLVATGVSMPKAEAAQTAQQIFASNCAVCHGTKGEGGIGPSLQQIANRRSFDQTVGFIENPIGPMPKLYPGKLSKAQVREVAMYIRAVFRSTKSASPQPYTGSGWMDPRMMYGYGPGGYGPGMMYGNGNGSYNGAMGPGMMYGPGGNGRAYQQGGATLNLSVSDVKQYFERWLTAEGNPHVKLGSVKVKSANTITADVVTKDKTSLVVRYKVNRHTGYISPE